MRTDEWRVEIAFPEQPSNRLFEEFRDVAGDELAQNPRGRLALFYCAEESDARAAIERTARQPGCELVCLERWDKYQDTWHAVEGVKQPLGSSFPAGRTRWVVLAAFLALEVIIGLCTFLIPAMKFSPRAGDLHSLGYTIWILILVDFVACVCFGLPWLRSGSGK